LNYIKPDFVHIMMGGRIVGSAGPNWLYLEGMADWLREKNSEAVTA
jgi:Fe-S cluster assembly ATPase SufC